VAEECQGSEWLLYDSPGFPFIIKTKLKKKKKQKVFMKKISISFALFLFRIKIFSRILTATFPALLTGPEVGYIVTSKSIIDKRKQNHHDLDPGLGVVNRPTFFESFIKFLNKIGDLLSPKTGETMTE
jgi:hypothetical protein